MECNSVRHHLQKPHRSALSNNLGWNIYAVSSVCSVRNECCEQVRVLTTYLLLFHLSHCRQLRWMNEKAKQHKHFTKAVMLSKQAVWGDILDVCLNNFRKLKGAASLYLVFQENWVCYWPWCHLWMIHSHSLTSVQTGKTIIVFILATLSIHCGITFDQPMTDAYYLTIMVIQRKWRTKSTLVSWVSGKAIWSV